MPHPARLMVQPILRSSVATSPTTASTKFTDTGRGELITAFKVVDLRAGAANVDGTDIVIGVEKLRFADRTVN